MSNIQAKITSSPKKQENVAHNQKKKGSIKIDLEMIELAEYFKQLL